MFKLKLIFAVLRRWNKQRKCEHEWLIPHFDLNQKEYRVFCTRCGKELWWGHKEKKEENYEAHN